VEKEEITDSFQWADLKGAALLVALFYPGSTHHPQDELYPFERIPPNLYAHRNSILRAFEKGNFTQRDLWTPSRVRRANFALAAAESSGSFRVRSEPISGVFSLRVMPEARP
jgi:hypothetical protein